MMDAVHFRAGAPPGAQNGERPSWQAQAFAVIGFRQALEHQATTNRIRGAAYAAHRRLHRKRLSCRWPAEVTQ